MLQVTVNQETVSVRENLSDLISGQVGPSLLFLHLYFLIYVSNCIFHSECSKEMLLLLFYLSLD